MEKLFLTLLQLLVASRIPWLVAATHSSLPLSSNGLFFFCMYVIKLSLLQSYIQWHLETTCITQTKFPMSRSST